MALYKPKKSAIPPDKRENMALEAERETLRYELEHRLAIEEEHLHKQYLREIQVRDREDELARRAMASLGPERVGFNFAGAGEKGEMLDAKALKEKFLYVTTDDIPGYTIIRVIGVVNGTSLRR